MENKPERNSVEIPKKLYDKLAERIKGTEFSSVGDYVVFVMMEVLAAEEAEAGQGPDKEGEGKVKDRLRSLGYLD